MDHAIDTLAARSPEESQRIDRRYAFVQLDVFTTRKFGGNPLAVFTDARGLSDAEMQALAREMNLSETTFIFPRDVHTERERGVQVRIFTVEEELPFAGHPTLGTAFALHGYERRAATAGMVRTRSREPVIHLDLKVGKIAVTFRSEEGGKLFGEMQQRDPEFGNTHLPEKVANACGLDISDIDPAAPIQTVSTGLPQAIVLLRSLDTLETMRPEWSRMADCLRETDARFFYFLAPAGTKGEPKLRARMLFYGGEDPATGSAAGNAAAWLVRYGFARPEEQVHIRQGVEIKRPSDLFVRASKDGDRVVNVRVGGHAVEVLRGEVFL